MTDSRDELWAKFSALSAANEAAVETWFVVPLLEALGRELQHIDSGC